MFSSYLIELRSIQFDRRVVEKVKEFGSHRGLKFEWPGSEILSQPSSELIY